MKDQTTQQTIDGTVTVGARRTRSGRWSVLFLREWMRATRFRRARIVLGDSGIVLIAADEIRRALSAWLDDPVGRLFRIVRIDPAKRTLEGVSVEMEYMVQPGAPPNGGPAAPSGNSGVTEGPPSVS